MFPKNRTIILNESLVAKNRTIVLNEWKFPKNSTILVNYSNVDDTIPKKQNNSTQNIDWKLSQKTEHYYSKIDWLKICFTSIECFLFVEPLGVEPLGHVCWTTRCWTTRTAFGRRRYRLTCYSQLHIHTVILTIYI